MKKRLRKKKAKELAQNYPFPWDRKWITKEEALEMFPRKDSQATGKEVIWKNIQMKE